MGKSFPSMVSGFTFGYGPKHGFLKTEFYGLILPERSTAHGEAAIGIATGTPHQPGQKPPRIHQMGNRSTKIPKGISAVNNLTHRLIYAHLSAVASAILASGALRHWRGISPGGHPDADSAQWIL